jgi:pyridoxine kinase
VASCGAFSMAVAPVGVLSFQSRVVWGHVGNAVAEFALRRLGLDCWPIDTVCFSNHPGYGSHRGRIREAGEIADLVEGLAAIGAFSSCRAVLSGYLGSAANGRAVLAAAARLKGERYGALWCCDPVIGDRDDGIYVAPDLVRFFTEEAVPAADILTPNHFELEVLAGRPLPELADVLAATAALQARGPKLIVVSSIITRETPAGTTGTLVDGAKGAWLVETPFRPLAAKGSGDLLAALFLGRRLQGETPFGALEHAVAATFAVIERTLAEPAARELAIVAAQDCLPHPPLRYPARSLR